MSLKSTDKFKTITDKLSDRDSSQDLENHFDDRLG